MKHVLNQGVPMEHADESCRRTNLTDASTQHRQNARNDMMQAHAATDD